MNSQGVSRGKVLLEGASRFEREPSGFSGLIGRLIAPSVHRILDQIDRGLERGSITANLPDGTTRLLGGRHPGFEAIVNVRDLRGILRLATNGSIGWYQAWDAGEWDSPNPVDVLAVFPHNARSLGRTGRAKGPFRLAAKVAHWLNRNNKSGSARNIHAHYDLGNDFYAQWLDPTMSYSSGLFVNWIDDPKAKEAKDPLKLAQFSKIDSIIDRIAPAKGGEILEVGCGWGAQAFVMAKRLDAHVDAISLSDQQLDYARNINENSVDAKRDVNYFRKDYRDVDGQYDAIVSVEMVEAVGREYWPSYFDCIARNLKPGGRAVIQFITIDDDLFDAYAASADFIQAYIFPGGLLIKNSEFQSLAAERGLRWEDQQFFGEDYAETLRLWRGNFDLAAQEGRLPKGFDERFIRLWRFYLMYCEGGFRAGGIDVSQVTLVKGE